MMRLFGGNQKTIASLIILTIVLFFVERAGLVNFIKSPIQKILIPVQLGVYKTKQDFSNFFSVFFQIGSLQKENRQLSLQNSLLLAENASLKKLEEENKVLRSQLGAKRNLKELILANVIGQDPSLLASELLIDKGEKEGVREGNIVVVGDILIGQVVAVSNFSARVRMLTDPQTKIPSVTQSDVKGIVEGEFGNRIVLVRVAQGQSLNKGEIVFSSGETVFPQGLVLGQIKEVKNEPADLFQSAVLSSLLDIDSLKSVFIVKEK